MKQDIRIHLDFSPEAKDELDKLQERLHATCPAEVVRDALGVLRWAIHHKRQGHPIMVQYDDKRTVQAKFPFLEKVQ